MDPVIAEDCLETLPKIDLSPMGGKTVLITGANGLIGSYLVGFLDAANQKQKLEIRIAAASKHPPCGKLDNVFDGTRNRFYPMDLAAGGKISIPCKADYIIHAATYAQPEIFMKNHTETMRLNISTTESLLEKAKEDGAAFLFLSSSEIYGNPDPEHIPTSENYPGLCPTLSARSIYAESKRAGETLCWAYRNLEKTDAKIARISMSYGPGLTIRDKRVMGQFIGQALKERKITMLDDGAKIRTFCYVADCALMLLLILLYGKQPVYNVGGKDRITIRNLAEEICAQTGSGLTVGKPAAVSGRDVRISPQAVELDISRITSEFHLHAFKPFREGLGRTIEWNRITFGL